MRIMGSKIVIFMIQKIIKNVLLNNIIHCSKNTTHITELTFNLK